jgi:hypothetical protein
MSLSNHQFGDLIPKLEQRHGDDFHDSVTAFALGTPSDPMAESSSSYDLPISRARVPLSALPDHGTSGAARIGRAQEGYRTSPSSVPPILLVQRAGRYDIADGHHRVQAARNLGREHIPAWVVHSPLKEPHPGFDD